MYQAYPLAQNCAAPCAGGIDWRTGAASDAVPPGSRALLQLSAPHVVQNQHQTGLAGAIGSGRRYLLVTPGFALITR